MLAFTSGVVLGEDFDDLVEREGLYYKKFTDAPFTGKVTGRNQGKIANGLIQGSWVGYYPNGQLWDKGDYNDGKPEGIHLLYHENGKLWYKATYKNGIQEGLTVSYRKNGNLKYKGYKKNDKKEGRWITYRQDGSIWTNHTGVFKNGVKISD